MRTFAVEYSTNEFFFPTAWFCSYFILRFDADLFSMYSNSSRCILSRGAIGVPHIDVSISNMWLVLFFFVKNWFLLFRVDVFSLSLYFVRFMVRVFSTQRGRVEINWPLEATEKLSPPRGLLTPSVTPVNPLRDAWLLPPR